MASELVVDFSLLDMPVDQIDKEIGVTAEELGYKGEEFIESTITKSVDITAMEVALLLDENLPLPDISQELEVDYQRQIQKFLVQYRGYLEELHFFRDYKARTHEIAIIVENIGTLPAEDIDVTLYFPDGFLLRDTYLSRPSQPPVPKKKSADEYLFGNLHKNSIMPTPFLYSSVPRVETASPSRPIIRRTNSYKVTFSKANLKHNHVWIWTPMWATFDKPSQLPTGFEVNYYMTIANKPEPIENKLVIRLREA